ncbi:UvrD-helicase domain-containing protein [Halocatena halophila]|uniref:UvrD-helicase domain-containing protein n=1 Tax=Halocatena halophila TaxID=2814576 RepID=UPI002ED40A13
MTEPNPQQQNLIDSTEGLYLVDAGAGTGKTFTITRRYANIVDTDEVAPEDVLLVTFTNNAASEMKDRIVGHCEYGMRDLADAPIKTFHSLCHDLLQEHGYDAPTYLGIDDCITDSTHIVEDDLVEQALFGEFIDRFSDDHPEYDDYFRIISDPTELLGLISQLASKGVFPTADDWYRSGERHLEGDFEAFKSLFDEINEPRNGGSKQSRLRAKLGHYGRNKCYLPDAPEKVEIRGQGTKSVPDGVARKVFNDDRESLKAFVHDIYYEYLEFALSRNYLNFGFLQLLAFVLLCEDHALRESIAFDYVMVDEFQDSSEIQFKLTLLLAETNNLCVVGDWKQSIYSFQYAEVENITAFEKRLDQFVAELNADYDRVTFNTRPIHTVELVENYRSTQEILDFSEHGLLVPAASRDDVDVSAVQDRIVSLTANAEDESTTIEAIAGTEEHESVVAKIQEIVGNDAYQVMAGDGTLRTPEYQDVAILTRTRAFGRELLQTAKEYGLPMAYEGGIELFRTPQAKLLLAWLRILESNAERGWAVVLERAGYTLDESKHILETEEYPKNMRSFHEKLTELETLGGIAERVFSRYGYDDATADVVLHTIQSVHQTTTLTRGDLIRFIERGIEAGSTHDVHTNAGTNSVTVQTIHAAKGLEHPIVVLANMNSGRFPPSGGESGTITFQEPVGLRQQHCYAEVDGLPHVYDDWRTDVLRRCLPQEYDEERRLLYVAITRAESHVIFSAGEDPNTFLEELPVEIEAWETAPDTESVDDTEQTELLITVPTSEGPVEHSPHSLMCDAVFENVDDGMGKVFGTDVHDFAEAYARGEKVTLERDASGWNDKQRVLSFLDGLSGDLLVEEDAYLPLEIDGTRVMISGIIDLVHVQSESVEVVDYKTDRSRHATSEYRKQLSVYYHVLCELYPEREISASIFYTVDGVREEIDPLTLDELADLVRSVSDVEFAPTVQ